MIELRRGKRGIIRAYNSKNLRSYALKLLVERGNNFFIRKFWPDSRCQYGLGYGIASWVPKGWVCIYGTIYPKDAVLRRSW